MTCATGHQIQATIFSL